MSVHAETLLTVTDVSRRYRSRAGGDILALDKVSFSLGNGEFVSVVGPSGCGKSTLLKLISGLVPPSSGAICYRGDAVIKPQPGMGIVFQSPVLMPWLTVLQNVLLPMKILGSNSVAARERALSLLAAVGLDAFTNKYPSELSGGMQQRVGIVRGLIHDPGVLLMDEPFGALDALTRERMGLQLQDIWMKNRKTVFFITHSITEAVLLSDRVFVMSDRPGHIVREFTIPFERPRNYKLVSTSEFGGIVDQIRNLLGASADV
ncbi:MAG TPA: ABC transporter ATP-binding protein [Xanthobacteraceae bacterium]|jgi:NitT/TauT family transport system ATP-binding protein|nr:ABC transporter ATP-binding protein [Xanthobacteraceae bacterium]